MADEAIQQCAALMMETIPLVMRTIGAEMHRRHGKELPMQQHGALMFIKDHQGASLSLVANHRGSSISATSKLIDGLVERGYLTRDISAADRRRVVLALTQLGEATLESVHREAVSYLAEILTMLSPSQCATVTLAMQSLRSVFAPVLVGKVAPMREQGDLTCQRS